MIAIDARCLTEPHPTGVTEVARQFIETIQHYESDSILFSTHKSFSNSITNLKLFLGTTTIEDLAGASEEKQILFSPNIHFTTTRDTTLHIQTVHDLSFFYSPQWYTPRVRLWHAATGAREQIQSAKIVVAVSDWTAQGINKHLGVKQESIFVVPPHRPKPEAPIRPALPFSDAPFFLFLGTLEKRKNIRGVIEAFERFSAKHPDYQLVLAGSAGFGAPKISALSNKIHHISYISAAEKWWLLEHARALLYPSFFEGFGLPPLEAAAVGCPSIIPDCTAPPETMGDSAVQVSPFDVKQIALALHTFAVDEAFRNHYSKAARTRAAWYSTLRQQTAMNLVLDHAHSLL